MRDQTSILTISNLVTSFDDFRAVDDVSFSLVSGETLGIVGESGSGKSVTALSIMGLVDAPGKIESGEIYFGIGDDNVDLCQLTESELRKYRGKQIGLVFQEPFSAFNPSLTCGKQIKEAVDLHLDLGKNEALEYIYSILGRVGISDPQRIYHSYPHELSGGQLQRALIAMAVVAKPKVLIADEPTTALDVTVQQQVLELFRTIRSEDNTALIFISHDLGVIREIADKVVVMYKGKIVESGDVNDIFRDPKHPYTQGLLECRPRLGRSLRRLPVIDDFISNRNVRYESVDKTTNGYRNDGSSALVICRDLSVSYPIKKNLWGKVTEEVNAVKTANFEIYPGETVGLVGESGSGKSSLGKAILKLIDHKGQLIYRDEDISHYTSRAMRPLRKKMQIIFQDPYSTLNPRMPVGSAIEEVLLVHRYDGDSRKRVYELLDQVGLDRRSFSKVPREFSGGQRQRISIARTLAVEPEFIVCDESVSALDVSVQAQILNLLKDLQDDLGLSYLFISHDLSVVKHMSDYLLVMKDGEIVEEGSPQRVYDAPQEIYTKTLISAIPGQSKNF